MTVFALIALAFIHGQDAPASRSFFFSTAAACEAAKAQVLTAAAQDAEITRIGVVCTPLQVGEEA